MHGMKNLKLYKLKSTKGFIYLFSLVNRMQGRQPVHLLHVGKTGGTALKDALKPHLTTGRTAILLHPHDVTLRDIPRGDHVMFFLRDPISRFVSGFYSRQRQGRPRHFSPWSPEEKLAFQAFETPNQLALALSSEDEGRRRSAEQAMRSIEHVRDAYWHWFEDEAYFRSRLSDVWFIGYQERLPEDFERLKTKLGLPPGVHLPTDDRRAHRNPQGIDTRLAPQAVENLKRWYAGDYAFLALCREKAERLNTAVLEPSA
jgi:hypothetical protein